MRKMIMIQIRKCRCSEEKVMTWQNPWRLSHLTLIRTSMGQGPQDQCADCSSVSNALSLLIFDIYIYIFVCFLSLGLIFYFLVHPSPSLSSLNSFQSLFLHYNQTSITITLPTIYHIYIYIQQSLFKFYTLERFSSTKNTYFCVTPSSIFRFIMVRFYFQSHMIV